MFVFFLFKLAKQRILRFKDREHASNAIRQIWKEIQKKEYIIEEVKSVKERWGGGVLARVLFPQKNTKLFIFLISLNKICVFRYFETK